MEVMKPHLARVASPTATSTSSSWSAAVVAGRKRRERLAEGAVRRGLKPAHQVAFGAPDLDDGARVHRHGRRPAGAEGAHALTGTCSERARFLARSENRAAWLASAARRAAGWRRARLAARPGPVVAARSRGPLLHCRRTGARVFSPGSRHSRRWYDWNSRGWTGESCYMWSRSSGPLARGAASRPARGSG